MQNIENKLSLRMKMVAGLLDKGRSVADIGCDHAYVSIYLLVNKIAKHVIAMDVRKGPLEIATSNISQFGLSSDIETRLSNGFEKLSVGETDAAIIAGMGGPLIVDILKQGLGVITEGYELILQPQSEIDEVRSYLRMNDFSILDEDMLIEEGKYYTVIKAVKLSNSKKIAANSEDIISNSEKELTDVEESFESLEKMYDMFGEKLLAKKHEVLFDFLNKEKEKKSEIVSMLTKNESDNEKTIARISSLNNEIKLIDLALECY